MIEKVSCEICKKMFKILTQTHLQLHGMTRKEYVQLFPNSLLISPAVSAKLSSHATRLNATRDYSEMGKKISLTKRQRSLPAHNKGIPSSAETRKKIADAKRGNKNRLGAILSDDTRSKISRSLINRAQEPDRVQARDLKHQQVEKHRQDKLISRFMRFEQAALTVNLKLLSINYKERVVQLRCLACGHEFTRTKQAVEDYKVTKTRCRVCNPTARTSIGQLEVFDFIKGLGETVIAEDRTVLGGKEIDIYLPDHHLGIEYNGLYWHSELNTNQPKHLLWKQQFAFKQGVRLIHLFEDEWRDQREIVKSRLRYLLGKQSTKIYARNCELIEVDSHQRDLFLTLNHIQGKDVSGIRYGLMYHGELVSVMTFKPSSFIKGGNGETWELNRFASKINITVVGGASRLFKKFLRDHDPLRVVSYADLRWNTGGIYQRLGFKFSHRSPPNFWYMDNYTQRYHRSKFMKYKILESADDKLLTGWEIMRKNGYDRIWDCGALVYNYTK